MIHAMAVAFMTGFIQVFLVAYQTRQIVMKAPLWSIFVVACAISAVWVLNVKAANAGVAENVAYVLGAGVGTITAMSTRVAKKEEGK